MTKSLFKIKNQSNLRVILVGFIALLCVVVINVSCLEPFGGTIQKPTPGGGEPTDQKVEGIDYFLPHIDLSHWKVTLPIGNPTEVKPPEILNYATNTMLKEFMYNDSTDGSLVFYTYPGASTANSSYSRTELREQMEPGSNNINWTFEQGGRMKGTLRMGEVSKDANNKYHRTIIMQIHGRLTNEQRDLIGEDDNNAPPVLKIYWAFGRVRVIRKVLKDVDAEVPEILHTNAWTDEAVYLGGDVGFEKFTLEVIASDGRMEVILNDNESLVYEDIHMKKWNVFENYFKAGNYLATKDEGAYSRVKYYDLEVSH
jgi:hypothetical protein